MLNRQQMAAVRYLEGPLLVLAGAGSGKTRVITEKIAYLIRDCGYRASAVCAVTFTNKAAEEMKTRIRLLLPAPMRRGLKIATFHTLGLRIIQRHAILCGLKPGFSIFDADDAASVLRSLYPVGQAVDRVELLRIQALISTWKGARIKQLGHDLPSDAVTEQALVLYPRYVETLKAYNAVDFDDLISLPVDLFENHASIVAMWRDKIRYLLIDEYQDSNASQYAMVQCLVQERQAFTVVGDDDQSIYAWRGANPENLMRLKHDYPQLKLIKLEQNYRSMGRILHAANALIAHNPRLVEKTLWSELGPGDLLRVLSCRDDQDEADQVVAELVSHKLRTRTCYRDYAILYRSNHQSRVFELALRQQGIPYRVSGGQSWFMRAEVKDVFAYIKLLCNPDDDAAFLRIINTPKRGIGVSSLTELGRYAQQQQQSLYACCDHFGLSARLHEASRGALNTFKQWFERLKVRLDSQENTREVLVDLIEGMGYEAYLYEQCDTSVRAQRCMDQVWQLVDWVDRLLQKDPSHRVSDVLHHLMLVDRLEQADDPTQDTVQLMTLHASKGLEFPHAYLVGMEEGVLPHHAHDDDVGIEEERRLAYVGITRAQQSLCFTLAKRRRRGGESHDCEPSRFLNEIPTDLLEWYGLSSALSAEQSQVLAKSHLANLKQLLAN